VQQKATARRLDQQVACIAEAGLSYAEDVGIRQKILNYGRDFGLRDTAKDEKEVDLA
jgi:hypothetical protein